MYNNFPPIRCKGVRATISSSNCARQPRLIFNGHQHVIIGQHDFDLAAYNAVTRSTDHRQRSAASLWSACHVLIGDIISRHANTLLNMSTVVLPDCLHLL